MKENAFKNDVQIEAMHASSDFSRFSIVFKNLDKSELAREIVRERIGDFFRKFPYLKKHDVRVCLSMENSYSQAGPDLFTAKMIVKGSRYKNLILEKSAPNLYQAIADLHEHLLERLNRAGDRRRVKSRNQKRRITRGDKHET